MGYLRHTIMTGLFARFFNAVLLAVCLVGSVPAQAPALTEFLASNDSGLQDEDGDRPDWIELHNGAVVGAVDLGGWSLTDDPASLAKWSFQPGTILAAGAYQIIFASSKDRRDPTGTLHANFKLSRGGEYLALVDPAGSIVTQFSPQYPPQTADISYGLSFNSAPTVLERFFITPTPGGPNGVGGPPAWGGAARAASATRRR